MKRIRQPSTWASIAALLVLAKAFVPPQYGIVIDSLVGAAGGLGIALNEAPAAVK